MQRHGFTLIELLLVVAIGAVIAGMAVPRIVTWRDRLLLANEAGQARALLDRARGAAIRLDRPVSVAESAGVVRVVTAFESRPAALAGHTLAPGTTLGGLERPISFGPLGLAIGAANRTLVLRRGSARRKVIVSRLGRIR